MPRPPPDNWIDLWLGVSGDGWVAVRRFGYRSRSPVMMSNRFSVEADRCPPRAGYR